jgi:HlyD family secretion protein
MTNHNQNHMRKHHGHKLVYSALVLIFMSLVSCGNHNHVADAYGNFEADEIIVSAESQGILTSLRLDEGTILEKDVLVGKIDSSTATIKKEQLKAQEILIEARLRNLDDQLRVQDEQRINLVRELNRIEKLLKEGAATSQQFDDIQGKVKVLDMQTEALRSQKNIIAGERYVLAAQMHDVDNMLEKCRILNPVQGTVLEKYVEAEELVSPGKALYKIAKTDKMELKVYVSGLQLPSIALGDSVDVFIDDATAGLQKVPGFVSWISSQVEFTPKIIQTREERVNMVYAVKVSVSNDGRMKIGMPGEVIFRKTQHAATH